MTTAKGLTVYNSMAANLIFVIPLLLSTTQVVRGSADHEGMLKST